MSTSLGFGDRAVHTQDQKSVSLFLGTLALRLVVFGSLALRFVFLGPLALRFVVPLALLVPALEPDRSPGPYWEELRPLQNPTRAPNCDQGLHCRTRLFTWTLFGSTWPGPIVQNPTQAQHCRTRPEPTVQNPPSRTVTPRASQPASQSQSQRTSQSTLIHAPASYQAASQPQRGGSLAACHGSRLGSLLRL